LQEGLDVPVKLCLNVDVSQKSKSLWGNLRRRLIAVLRVPGAKTNLALKMGVSRPAVSQWIADDGTAPTAEMTLQLLAWVQVEEAKQKKALAVSLPPPERKTRVRSSKSYEKTKSSPQKQ
jgi:transcriptional regulator with XRE-family HTH domain